MQKDKPPSVLGEALLDVVVPRRKPQDCRPKRPDQPANTFINRSGELASAVTVPNFVPEELRRGKPAPKKDEG